MIEKLYSKLPRFLQNIIITLKNIQVYNYKYGYIPLIKPLSKIQEDILNKEFLINDDSNIEKLKTFIRYSKNHTNFYKENCNLYPEIENIEDFSNVSLLPKRVLKENIASFYSDEISKFNHVKFRTSGTTGSPMEGYIKKKDLQNRYKTVLKTMCMSGFDITRPYARFIGKNVADADIIYRKDIFHHHYFFSIFHLSVKTIHKYYEALVQNKIEFIEGYPSTINNMVNLFRECNLTLKTIKGVYVTAEKLSVLQKNNIERFFGCKVFDYYGSTEQSIYIYSGHNNKYYTSNLTGYLEVIKENGQFAKPGEEGRMIITSFTSHFTPLIKYDIGDRCVVSEIKTLNDGSLQYVLEEIIGRNEETLKTLDGRFLSRFSLILKFLPVKVKGAQLYLSEIHNSVKIRYTSDNEIEIKKFGQFIQKMNLYIGDGYDYSIEKVEQIEKNNSGKVRTVFIEKN